MDHHMESLASHFQAANARHQSCNLCGQLTQPADVRTTKIDANLCLSCFEHLEMMPEDPAKESLGRFLIGNVI